MGCNSPYAHRIFGGRTTRFVNILAGRRVMSHLNGSFKPIKFKYSLFNNNIFRKSLALLYNN